MLLEKKVLSEFAELIDENKYNPFSGILKTGVDLGTANIVLAVVDENNRPIAGAALKSKVVKDGVVVDFIGGVKAVKHLKEKIEKLLGVTLITAATAVPPGITDGNIRCISNVVEGAGFLVSHVLDEPSAAAAVLDITEGAVVDVGGGTTGISIIQDGKVVFTADEATGGSHMTLVLAGYYGISYEEAELMKTDPATEADVYPIIRPVVQKMASIVKHHIEGYGVQKIYLVGGACCFTEYEDTFEAELNIPVIKTNDSLLVTPLGIAWSVKLE